MHRGRRGRHATSASGDDDRLRAVLLAVLATAAVVVAPIPAAANAAGGADTDRLVVDADGDTGYQTIQGALDDATAGDVVTVRPGEYDDAVVKKDVRLVAPDGATARTIDLAPNVTTTVSGFDASYVGFADGAPPFETHGDWTFEGLTVGAVGFEDFRGDVSLVGSAVDGSVYAGGASGDVTVRDTAANSVLARNATGNWTMTDVAIRDGLSADAAEGTWALANVTTGRLSIDGDGAYRVSDAALGSVATEGDARFVLENATYDSISVSGGNGDLHLRNVSGGDIYLGGTDWNWSVAGGSLGSVSVQSTTDPGTLRDATVERLSASDSTGAWTAANLTVTTTDARYGVVATNTSGDWVLRNATAARGVTASGSGGDWTVADLTVTDGRVGVSAFRTTGDWTVDGLRTRGLRYGVDAANATGAWTVRDARIVDARVGLSVGGDGDRWRVANATIRDVGVGIRASDLAASGTVADTTVAGASGSGVRVESESGELTVRRTTIANVTRDGLDVRRAAGDVVVADSVVADAGLVGVRASESTGSLRVTGSVLDRNGVAAVVGNRSDPAVDAIGNYWGQPDGALDGQCLGAVDCGGALSDRPADAGDGDGDVGDGGGSGGVSVVSIDGRQFPLLTDRNGTSPVRVAVRNEGDAAATATVEGTFSRPDGETVVRSRETTVDPTDTNVVTLETFPLDELRAPHAGATFSAEVDGDWVEVTYEGGGGDVPTDLVWVFAPDVQYAAPVGVAARDAPDRLAPGDTVSVPLPDGGADADYAARVGTRFAFTVTVDGTQYSGTGLAFDELPLADGDGDGSGGGDGADLGNISYGQTRAGAVDAGDARTGPFTAPHENVTFDGERGDAVSLALRRTNGSADPTLTLVAPSGRVLQRNATGDAPRLANVTLPADGDYTVVVAGTESNATFAYELSLDGRPTGTIVVDDDGGEGVDYARISPAVANASDDATVRVRPGTYVESVAIDGNVTVVAPDGATVRAPDSDPVAAFEVTGGAPTVDGFVVEGFETGVDAANTAGDWTVANLAVGGGVRVGVNAFATTGDWVVRNATVDRDSRVGDTAGVRARTATGDWTVANARFSGVERGVAAAATEGEWTVRDAAVRDVGIAVDAGAATGDWRLVDATIRAADTAVLAADTTGEWTVRNATVVDAGQLSAAGSTGAWTLRDVVLRRTGGVDASESEGDWVVRGLVASDGDGAALTARAASGAWRVRNATLVGHDRGVAATESTGDWLVAGSRVAEADTGVDAADATGDWRVRRSNVTGNDVDVDATGANPAGDARRNYWGPGGTDDADCIGNVTCADPRGGDAAPTSGLRVTVADADGDPVGDATVYVYADAGPVTVRTVDVGDAPPAGATATNTTNAGGGALFEDLGGGDHCLLVVPDGDGLAPTGRCVPLTDGVLTTQTVVLDAPATTPTRGSWRQFQNGPRNTGRTAADGPRAAPVVAWRTSIAEGALTAPVVADGRVFVATDRGLAALDADTGAVEWRHEGPTGDVNGPVVVDDTVVYRSGSEVIALEATSGTTRWTNTIDDPGPVAPRASLTAADSTVVVPVGTLGDSGFVAYDLASGDREWEQRFDDVSVGLVETTPAISDGTVYGGSLAGKGEPGSAPSKTAFALDLETGAVQWAYTGLNTIESAPTVGDGRVYFPRSGGQAAQVVALDAADGTVDDSIGTNGLLRRDTWVGYLSSPALRDGRIYIADGDGFNAAANRNGTGIAAIAVDGGDYGDRVWNEQTTSTHAGSPAVTPHSVYTVGLSSVDETPGSVTAVDVENGDVRWRYHTDAALQSSPAVADGSLYVTTTGSKGRPGALAFESAFAQEPESLVDPDSATYLGHLALDAVDASDPTASGRIDRARSRTVETASGTTVVYRTATFVGAAGQDVTATLASELTEGDTLDLVGASRVTLVDPTGDVVDTATAGATEAVVDATLPRDGVYTVVVSNAELAGAESRDVAFDLTVASPSATATTVETTGDAASVTVENANAGDRVTANVSTGGESRVTSLSVTFAAPADGRFDVTSTTDAPADLPDPPADADSYLRIDHPSVPDSAIGSGELTVELAKSTVDDPANVTVYRYDDGVWTAVPTEHVGETGDAFRFRVTTPGFSTFAAASDPPADGDVDATANESASAETATTPDEGEDSGDATTASGNTPGFGAFAWLLAAVLAAGVARLRRRGAVSRTER